MILAQAAHSVEECRYRLYEVWPPARWVAGLFSRDLALGFAIGNVLLVLFGLWCYFMRVRPDRASARAWAWFWTVLEGANGTGHLLLAAVNAGYFPGAATAPLLLGLSAWLALLVSEDRRNR